ncbi:MAG: radical SAM family heme chaperone HemW [candidate division Zixibacteria bacterium]|nr:radical SAM family heme chaperone HemW [candidate division Zixibacteria bacterium]
MSLGLYLHFPFCRNTCSYCDFYKELHSPEQERAFFSALEIETRLAAEQLQDRDIRTIYVGGGTPSLSNLELFARWLEQVRGLFHVLRGIEFSFECNPESVSVDGLERLGELGVNRPVFGVQSFDKKLLKRLGRRHNVHDTHQSVYLANALSFATFGVDQIFGIPGQTGKMLSTDLDAIVDLQAPHISYYHLTVEPGTPLAEKVDAGKLRIPEADRVAAFYRAGCEFFAEAGYKRYEICSFAKPGHECKHNLGYWEGEAYIGLGPAAHSFVGEQRFYNPRSIDEWASALHEGNHPGVPDDSGPDERMTEAIMLGLRISRGIDRARFAERFDCDLDSRLNSQQYEILVKAGYLISEPGALRLSDEGFYLADEIARRLLK